jgi:thioredoxin
MAHETTDATFAQDVLNSALLVMVDFWAPWCGPCRIAEPILERVVQKAQGRAWLVKLNVDENPVTARRYGIGGIPTVIIFHQGTPGQQLVGVQPEAVYLKALGL